VLQRDRRQQGEGNASIAYVGDRFRCLVPALGSRSKGVQPRDQAYKDDSDAAGLQGEAVGVRGDVRNCSKVDVTQNSSPSLDAMNL